MRLSTILLLLFITASTIAQNVKFRKREVNWELYPENHSVKLNPKYKNEDAVILYEDSEISVHGEGVDYNYYGGDVFTKFFSRVFIKFNTNKGIKIYNRFVLPASFDPLTDYIDVPYHRKHQYDRPKLYDMEITFFGARIYRKDGSVEFAKWHDAIAEEAFMLDTRRIRAFSHIFKLKDIQPGDIVEVVYHYWVPYRFYANRFFMHGKLLKQQMDFSFSYPKGWYFVTDFRNGFAPDTIPSIKPARIILEWSGYDLRGCINEPGARIYEDLPYMRYYIHGKDYGTTDKNGNIVSYTPYNWWWVIYKYFPMVRSWRKYDPGFFHSNDDHALKELYQRAMPSSSDSISSIRKIYGITKYMNEKFDYQNDSLYYAGADSRLERMGKFVRSRILRDMSRFKVYGSLINMTGVHSYLSIMIDNRIDNFDPSTPFLLSEYKYRNPRAELFYTHIVVEHDKEYFYVYPKKHRFGFHVNEMPFYLENTSTILGRQSITKVDNVDLIIQTLSSSNENDNTRESKVHAKVNTAERSINLNSKIDLSGQFSTLKRGAYLYNYKDRSVNPLYFRKIYQVPGKVYLESERMSKSSEYFPFNSQFRINYKIKGMIVQNGDTLTVKCHDWLAHVTYFLGNGKRYLPYYPDFRFTDRYSYTIEFEKDVELIDGGRYVLIRNDYGSIEINIQQSGSRKVNIESTLQVLSEKVLPENFEEVKQLQSAIREAARLEISVVNQ
ncbi:MAG: hypothetical protein IH946_03190 [Bacteroidetes bacterium]|nr:hypothetical protein [Bacteroidota bacterium]